MNIPRSPWWLFVVLVFSLGASATEYTCTDGQFVPVHETDRSSEALAQVFNSGGTAAKNYVGTAFVIDAKNGILLTAGHVVKKAIPGDGPPTGKTLKLRFPGIEATELLNGTVKAVIHEPRPRNRSNFVAGYQADDIAVIQLNEVHRTLPLQHLRLSLMQWTHPVQGEVFTRSYYRASNDIVPATGRMTRVSDHTNVFKNVTCLMNITSNTDFGDSGAPVVDADGYVVGIVVHAIPKDETKQGQIVPTHCLPKHLPKIFQSIAEQDGAELARTLHSKSAKVVAASLMPSVESDMEYSNPMIHFAFDRLVATMESSSNLEIDVSFLKKLHCPIGAAARDRKITIPGDLFTYTAYHLARTNRSLRKDANEHLLAARDDYRNGDHYAAATNATVSRSLFFVETSRRLLSNVQALNDLPALVSDGGLGWVSFADHEELAKDLLSFVESSQLIRNAERQLGYSFPDNGYPISLIDAAGAAAFASRKGDQTLHSRALAALGNEALYGKDYLRAIGAFLRAYETGARNDSIASKLGFASQQYSQELRLFSDELSGKHAGQGGRPQSIGVFDESGVYDWTGPAEKSWLDLSDIPADFIGRLR